MIAWYWCVLMVWVAFYLGCLVMGLCHAAGRDRNNDIPGRWTYPERRKR